MNPREKFLSENMTFEGQKEGENIIFVLHQHPWTLAKLAFEMLALAVLVATIFMFFGLSWVFFYVFAPSFLIGGYFVLRGYFTWQNNVYILTNLRILAVAQKGFFHRKVSEVFLEKIADITYEIKGFWQTMLNFGNVLIKTSGQEAAFEILKVDNPFSTSQKITQIVEERAKS
ncbi:MAG: hypothetical protein COU44_01420, partial [Candidatus Nealsonbacteria bacterium CG10_big_fil_rev_8_21_14_0_10_40_24]